MSVFEGIEHVSAEGTSNRLYFEPGQYVVEIDSVILHSKKLGGGKLFIVETFVRESDNPRIKLGEQRNWVQSLNIPYALPRIKAFIGAALGICPQTQIREINDKVSTDICNQSVSLTNPLKGKILQLSCVNKITLTGKEFIHHIWGVPHE